MENKNSIQEGLSGSLPIINSEDKKKKPVTNFRYQRDKDREKVKGVFQYHECPGQYLEFAFRKWKGDPIEYYKLQDGAVYSIPRGVAKHLNTSGAYPQHEYAQDENGKPIARLSTPRRRYGFQSLEFTSWDELEKEDKIITVEKV